MIFGDKTIFAIEASFFDDPDSDRWAGWDEVGTYGHFDLFVSGKSVFKCHCFEMEEDPGSRAGYKILDKYHVYDDGRTDHLAPLYQWLGYVYDVVTATSKTRFKLLELNNSPYGTYGNIYPPIYVKRSGDEVIVGCKSKRSDFFFNRHVEYPVTVRLKMDWLSFAEIIRAVLEDYYAQPSVNQTEWFKEYNPRFLA